MNVLHKILNPLQLSSSEAYIVALPDGQCIDYNPSITRARDRKWELENENPAYAGKTLVIGIGFYTDKYIRRQIEPLIKRSPEPMEF